MEEALLVFNVMDREEGSSGSALGFPRGHVINCVHCAVSVYCWNITTLSP
jgi:hypothetical protein